MQYNHIILVRYFFVRIEYTYVGTLFIYNYTCALNPYYPYLSSLALITESSPTMVDTAFIVLRLASILDTRLSSVESGEAIIHYYYQ